MRLFTAALAQSKVSRQRTILPSRTSKVPQTWNGIRTGPMNTASVRSVSTMRLLTAAWRIWASKPLSLSAGPSTLATPRGPFGRPQRHVLVLHVVGQVAERLLEVLGLE